MEDCAVVNCDIECRRIPIPRVYASCVSRSAVAAFVKHRRQLAGTMSRQRQQPQRIPNACFEHRTQCCRTLRVAALANFFCACDDAGSRYPAVMTGGSVTEASGTAVSRVTLAFLGGTGDQGRGLARRFAIAGHHVVLGSRQVDRAEQAATELRATVPDPSLVHGATNEAAAAAGDVVVVAVPWEGHEPLIKGLASALAGKVVIDCVNPMGFDSRGAFALDVAEGSAAQQAAALLPDSTVVAAFHHVSAVLLLDPAVGSIETDVLVLGEERSATDLVQALVDRIEGMRGVYGGRLRNAGQVEALTANLVSINRRYKAHAGLRVTDI
jgi:8-hydroxy-5-deazaflavin:NADPH oxidoreductase